MVAIAPFSRSRLSLVPRLFVGIDVGKKNHVAGFVSANLLREHHRFDQCPTFAFEASGNGIATLLKHIQEYGPLSQCVVLLENTGHYHRTLYEQLSMHGLTVYTIAVRTKRLNGVSKTDRIDSLRLANLLYSQIGLGVQLVEQSQQIREIAQPTTAALRLAGLVQRRYELVADSTRVKNKLTAICDELFPEFTSYLKNPNLATALELRSRWPTPALLAEASLEQLKEIRTAHGPGLEKLKKLREAGATSIGITNAARVESLCFEQKQLIAQLRLLEMQLEALEQQISTIVEHEREGQILLSMPMIGTVTAATILAFIGNIRNFPSKAALRKYCGWAPQVFQTGTSLDRSRINPTGSRLLRDTIYLWSLRAIKEEQSFWYRLASRLTPLKCTYNAKTHKYNGKLRVVGRVAGQMIGVVYALLKADADLVDSITDETLPPPQLYDPAVHAGSLSRTR